MSMIEESGRAKRFHRKTSTLLTDINVTPFVDVMLVLLIIFMVTAPLLQSGVAVDLPKEDTGQLDVRDENVVTLRRDGAIFFNDKRVTQKDLKNRLQSIAETSTNAEVFLRADKLLAYGDVMKIMGLIKKAGISRLGMVTEASEKGGR